MANEQNNYRTDYNAKLTDINNLFDALDAKFRAGDITKDEYNDYKYELTKCYSTTLENKHLEDMIYNNITDENDKNLYASSVAFLSGDLTACKGSADFINAMYKTSPGFFESFSESSKPVQNRTFTMGETYYDGVIKAAENNKINLNELGIECNRDNGEFTVPKDPKAILQFAECYAIAGGYEETNGFWEGIYATLGDIFSDTANNFFNGDTRTTDHEFLATLGLAYNKARNNIKRIEKENGIVPYYIPIMSPGVSDITRMRRYIFGDNTSELNLIDENLFDRLKIADLYSYKIYANDADVTSETGNGALSETNDPKTIQTLSNLIKNSKKEEVTFAFATCGYEYGTMVNVNKNGKSIKCFISELFPSEDAENYVKSPMFQAKAFLDIVKARNGGATVAHRNDLGSYYSGYFHASNNQLFYRMDRYQEDNQYINIGDATALPLRMFTLMFEQMCLNKQRLDNVSNIELPTENEVLQFITQRDENGNMTADMSLVSILNALTGDSEIDIINRLMDHYNNYYK